MLKKLYILFVLLLVGCNNKVVNYELVKTGSTVYAVEINSNDICSVNIDYIIIDEKDVFLLYTKYQNYLPLGYSSPACSNIGLIKCYSDKTYTYYEVDLYINYVDNIACFKECISKTNKLYGFNDAVFLINGVEVL